MMDRCSICGDHLPHVQDCLPFRIPIIERLISKIHVTPTCWLWTGALYSNGYGHLGGSGRGSKGHLAHKLAYELFVGPIPPGLDLDHLCHNQDRTCPGGSTCIHRRCVRPSHLSPTTRSKNLRNSGRTGGPRR